MHLRRAESADLEAIVAIDPVSHAEPSRRVFLERMVRSGECWLAEEAGTVLGFAVLDDSFYGNGFVPLLVVRPGFRRRGIGRALLECLVSVCNTSKIFSSTNESNTAMRALLTRAGFEASGVIYNLEPGDPELVFFRRLHP
ncbi:GNAT family N-acetyltransferase [Myxococcota bacterium]|nr:GNAT family N-acetyltransferase [Myxococcota bacterium]MCZ7617251.1 GNAT family N-acetyltransferase [Myxococcota bacterium]